MNYRIEEQVPVEEVFAKIEQGERGLKWLAERDQLNIERKQGRVFWGFEEGDCSLFPPTYKYQPGYDCYDQRPEKKIRAPAWCDRVLWRCRTTINAVELLEYGRSELRMSDHKPVRAALNILMKKQTGQTPSSALAPSPSIPASAPVSESSSVGVEAVVSAVSASFVPTADLLELFSDSDDEGDNTEARSGDQAQKQTATDALTAFYLQYYPARVSAVKKVIEKYQSEGKLNEVLIMIEQQKHARQANEAAAKSTGV